MNRLLRGYGKAKTGSQPSIAREQGCWFHFFSLLLCGTYVNDDDFMTAEIREGRKEREASVFSLSCLD